ncbi:MAG: RhuM family protein, partial [Bacilli bacterium]
MNKEKLQITNHDFIIYKDDSGNVKVNVMLINHDLWLTQDLIAELFGTARNTITDHINNIFKSGELEEKTSVGISDQSTGGRKAKLYNLDVIIAVGYRVNSKKATNFRIWATNILKEYMIKGAVLDVERL